MSDSIYLYHSMSLPPSPQSVPSSPSHSLLTFPSSSLPFHNISSSVSSTALDVQHFWKPFTVTSDEIAACCDGPHWLNTTFIFLVHKLTWTMKIHSFLHRWCYWCKEFKYTCAGVLCHICGLVSLSSWLFFMVCNVLIGPGFIFDPCS